LAQVVLTALILLQSAEMAISSILSRLGTTLLLVLVAPLSSGAHEGKLDPYGCHYDRERKDYHCHEGVFKGGSFDSRVQMIRLLRLQFLNLGRPWPYGDVAEEHITSIQNETQ
jgi:hypothetical protein